MASLISNIDELTGLADRSSGSKKGSKTGILFTTQGVIFGAVLGTVLGLISAIISGTVQGIWSEPDWKDASIKGPQRAMKALTQVFVDKYVKKRIAKYIKEKMKRKETEKQKEKAHRSVSDANSKHSAPAHKSNASTSAIVATVNGGSSAGSRKSPPSKQKTAHALRSPPPPPPPKERHHAGDRSRSRREPPRAARPVHDHLRRRPIHREPTLPGPRAGPARGAQHRGPSYGAPVPRTPGRGPPPRRAVYRAPPPSRTSGRPLRFGPPGMAPSVYSQPVRPSIPLPRDRPGRTRPPGR